VNVVSIAHGIPCKQTAIALILAHAVTHLEPCEHHATHAQLAELEEADRFAHPKGEQQFREQIWTHARVAVTGSVAHRAGTRSRPGRAALNFASDVLAHARTIDGLRRYNGIRAKRHGPSEATHRRGVRQLGELSCIEDFGASQSPSRETPENAGSSMKHLLTTSVAGQDPPSLFSHVSDWPEFRNAGLPARARIGHNKVTPENWLSIQTAPVWGIALWDIPDKQLGIRPKSDLVSLEIPDFFERLTEVVERISLLPFYLAALGPLWRDAWDLETYQRWGFGRSIIDHGWGCAFRGVGHDRLVSRRWLDFGPWRVIRRPHDTTFIQFHDLAITDPAEAYAQAKVGHERMGISPSGGYIAWHYENLLKGADAVSGLYQPATRTLEIVVGPGNEVKQGQMICQCARRLHHRIKQPINDRIDHVAYVFMDRGDAQAHLHELWLRELQCWYVDERGKHRLDADYHPTPQPPAWVANLKANAVNDV